MNKGCVQIFSFIILIEHDFNVYRSNAYSMVLAKVKFHFSCLLGWGWPTHFLFLFYSSIENLNLKSISSHLILLVSCVNPPLAQEWNIEAEPIIYWAMEKNATIGSYIEKPYIILSQSFSSIVIKALHYIKDMKGYE